MLIFLLEKIVDQYVTLKRLEGVRLLEMARILEDLRYKYVCIDWYF
jgi:hypothetical protein